MKTSILLLYSLALLSVVGCQNQPDTIDGVKSLDIDEIEEVGTSYTVSHIVPLETTADNLLGDNLLVKTHENNIFILDGNARNAIHHFNITGSYLGKVVEVGEAPGTVKNIRDFVPTDSGLEVLVGMGESSHIIVLDKDFTILREIKLDYQGSSFEKLADGSYVVSGSYNKPLINHRVAVLSADGEKLKVFLPNDYSNQMLPMEERNFHKEGERVFFHEVFNPIAYEISDDTLEARHRFDFGRYALPSQFWEMDIMQGFEMINKNGFANIYSYWENESIAFCEIYIEGEGENKNHQIIWDKESNKAVQRVFSQDQDAAFYHPVGLIGEQLVFIAQAAHVLNLETEFDTQAIDKDDNPALLFVDF
jgi:hypothetical protein